MGLFSTRNSDGASALAESCNTLSKQAMDDIHDRAVKHNPRTAALFTPEAAVYRKAHRIDKAGTN